MKQKNSRITYESIINDFSFFSKETKDWDINHFSREDCKHIYYQHNMKVNKEEIKQDLSDMDTAEIIHELKRIRDAYLDNDSDIALYLNEDPTMDE